MPKKCPPGVFCIENITLTFLVLILFIVGFLYYQNMKQNRKVDETKVEEKIVVTSPPPQLRVSDVFNDPYAPPLKNTYVQGMVPVNIPTQGLPQPYGQVGILTNNDGENLILPLMGRRYNSDKWTYYTISNSGNLNTKLQVIVNGKSGTYEYGVNELFSGDTVTVDGYNKKFIVTIYNSSQFNYLPY